MHLPFLKHPLTFCVAAREAACPSTRSEGYIKYEAARKQCVEDAKGDQAT